MKFQTRQKGQITTLWNFNVELVIENFMAIISYKREVNPPQQKRFRPGYCVDFRIGWPASREDFGPRTQS